MGMWDPDVGLGDNSEALGEPSPRWGPEDHRVAPRGGKNRGPGQEQPWSPRNVPDSQWAEVGNADQQVGQNWVHQE